MAHTKKGLLDLPNELLLEIGNSVATNRDLNALVRANHRMHALLNGSLYRRNVQRVCPCPLEWAASRGRIRTFELFLEHGSNVNENTLTFTPLHIAMIHQQEEIGLWLINRGARVVSHFYQGSDDFTTLQLASHLGLGQIVEMLLNRGLPTNTRRRLGQSPIQCALTPSTVPRKPKEGSRTKVICLLLSHGWSLSKADLMMIGSPEQSFRYDVELHWGWTLPAIIGERQIYCFHASAPCVKGLSEDDAAATRAVSTGKAAASAEVLEKFMARMFT